jgi:2-polyprenyl-3-methyl-5-hydroxy-6-metoxy-1,4-benzoquinol methylase
MIMSTDSPEFWNETWADIEASGSGSDEILAEQVQGLAPGRALELACGLGGNAVWLAKAGWTVTATDYSAVAIEKARKLAVEQGVGVEFIVADATSYQPQRQYDLIMCFYIQLFPTQRSSMLANVSKMLTPGGTLIFVSHDKTGSPSGWSEEDLASLTTPEEIVADLPELQIEHAAVLRHDDGSRNTIVRAIRPK